MDSMSLPQMVEILKYGGLPAAILMIWYFSSRDTAKLLRQYRDDTMSILKQHKSDMDELRQMYENNVELVKLTQNLARDLRETVLLNTAKWQQAHDAICGNQFCPNVRLEKSAKGVQP
jgi:hypothetical protein